MNNLEPLRALRDKMFHEQPLHSRIRIVLAMTKELSVAAFIAGTAEEYDNMIKSLQEPTESSTLRDLALAMIALFEARKELKIKTDAILRDLA